MQSLERVFKKIVTWKETQLTKEVPATVHAAHSALSYSAYCIILGEIFALRIMRENIPF